MQRKFGVGLVGSRAFTIACNIGYRSAAGWIERRGKGRGSRARARANGEGRRDVARNGEPRATRPQRLEGREARDRGTRDEGQRGEGEFEGRTGRGNGHLHQIQRLQRARI